MSISNFFIVSGQLNLLKTFKYADFFLRLLGRVIQNIEFPNGTKQATSIEMFKSTTEFRIFLQLSCALVISLSPCLSLSVCLHVCNLTKIALKILHSARHLSDYFLQLFVVAFEPRIMLSSAEFRHNDHVPCVTYMHAN